MYVSQPLDTVKVKMQTFPTIYKGMGNCLMQTLKKDGIIRGWYAGTAPAIVANVAENSILFAGNCRSWLENISANHKNNIKHNNCILLNRLWRVSKANRQCSGSQKYR